jgi:hypothetical protein
MQTSYTHPETGATLDNVEAALGLVREALAGLKRPPAPTVWGIDPNLRAGDLAAVLWRRLGQRRFRLLMTKMANLDREVRQEARLERRLANGNGHAEPVAPAAAGNGHARLEG